MYTFIVPGVLFFVVFHYLPLGGIVIAFQDYSPFLGFAGSTWVGTENFTRLIGDTEFWTTVSNTLVISGLQILFAFPAPILLALLLNSLLSERVKRVVQSIVYLPHFISWVIVISIWQQVLGGAGPVAELYAQLGAGSVNLMANSETFKILLTSQVIWKDIGWGTIIFFAAISAISTELYESAAADGAGPLRRIWHITLPGHPAGRGVAVDLATGGRAQCRVRADPAAAAVGRRRRGAGAGHLRLLPRRAGRRLGDRCRRRPDQGRRRHRVDHHRQCDRQAHRQRGAVLMATALDSLRVTADRSNRPVWMGKPPMIVRVLKGVVIAAIVAVMLYPFGYVIFSSFGSPTARLVFGLFPSDWTTNAYRTIFSGGIVTRSLLVSAGVTLVGTVLSVSFTAMLAYGLTRTRQVPFARAALILVLLTMLFSAGIIPNFLLVKSLGLVDTYAALIFPVLISAFNMIVMRNFFMQLPSELFDAARVDGAGEWRIFTSLVLPLSKAVLAVIGLFYAVGYWNAYFNPLIYLNDPAKWPIQLVLNQYVLQGSPMSQMENPDIGAVAPRSVQMAVVVVATLPILIVYPFVQKYFTKGVLTGAIKG